ncbi:UDP-glucose 4-epimerase [Methylocaldum marinum]|uniref:UDP-glucose 4-epimerase n=1 Tax=Methylocaldum marinum TaxID=1432792 RepID=A0A250KMG3_9GAMM|nr:UDP-glucose 4-epimerase [Methylocaldum marinum]
MPADAELIVGDVTDTAVAESVQDCEVVFHLAARVAIRSSFEFIVEDVAANVLGTASLLKAFAASPNTGKFIFASSMAVYADSEQAIPIDENYIKDPISPYGISKFAAEMLVMRQCKSVQKQGIALRLFNTYGPGQIFSPYVGVVTIFTRTLMAGKAPSIFGDGLQCRDFVHVDDVVRGFLAAMDEPTAAGVYNIGSGIGTTINDVYRTISDTLNLEMSPNYENVAQGELRYSIANIDKARSLLGYEPQHRFDRSIVNVIREITENKQ